MIDYLDAGTGFRLGDTGVSSITKVTGLSGIPGVRGDVYDRPEADGSVEPPNQYKTARFPVIEGEVWGTTIDAAWDTWNLLQGVLDDMIQTAQPLKFRPANGTRDMQTAPARFVSDAVAVFEDSEIGPFIKYQIMFRCADPLLVSQLSFSAVASAPSTGVGMPLPVIFPIPFGSPTGGTLQAQNNGNTAAWPLITITGPIINPAVGNATLGKFLYFDSLILSAGDILIIDTNPASRGATVAGSSKIGSLRFIDSLWPSMTKGALETWQFYAMGGGTTVATTMTLSWRNTYVS